MNETSPLFLELEPEAVGRLDELVRILPRMLAEELTRMLVNPDPRTRLVATTLFTEKLTAHLCHILTSEYHAHAGEPDREIEKQLRSLSAKGGLAFGDYLASLDLLARKRSKSGLIPELGEALRGALPPRVASGHKRLALVVEARGYEIPPHRLGAYVETRSAAQSASKKAFGELVKWVLELRNQMAHPNVEGADRNDAREAAKSRPSWWVEDLELFTILNQELGVCLAHTLLWPPMFQLLTRYEIVQVGGKGILVGGRYRAPAIRQQIVAPIPPLPIFSDEPLEERSRVVTRREPSTEGLEYVMRLHEFPRSRGNRTRLIAGYRREYAHRLVNDGRIDGDERTALQAISSRDDLLESEVRDLESTCAQSWLNAVRKDAPAHGLSDEARQKLADWIAADAEAVVGEPPADVASAATALLDIVLNQARAYVENEAVVSGSKLRFELGLPAEVARHVLQRLAGLSEGQDSAPLGDPQEARLRRIDKRTHDLLEANYEWHDPSDAAEFVKLLERVEETVQRGDALPDLLWPLLRLTNKVLADESIANQGARIDQYEAKARDVQEQKGEPLDANPGAVDSAQVIKLTLPGGQQRSFPRSTQMMREFPGILNQLDVPLSELVARLGGILPLSVGRTRYFIAKQPRHKNGRDFGYAIDVQVDGEELFFEANFTRADAQFHMQSLLDSLATGEVLAVEGERGDTQCEDGMGLGEQGGAQRPSERAPATDSGTLNTSMVEVAADPVASDAFEEIDLDLPGLDILDEGRVVCLRNARIPEFLKTVFLWLSEQEDPKAADGSSRLDKVDLPFAMGRTKYFVAEAPVHRDERPFARELRVAGLYVESALSWEAALENTRRLCDAAGFKVEVHPPRPPEELAIRLDDGGLLGGDNVRGLLTQVLNRLATDGKLKPDFKWSTGGTKRFLVADTPLHGTGTPFANEVEFPYEGVQLYAEAALPRADALAAAKQLLTHLGYGVVAVGEAALKWDGGTNEVVHLVPSSEVTAS